MLSEAGFLVLLLFISVQSSAIWLSMALIPSSLVIVISANVMTSQFNLVSMLYVMVFIGGLLVLLVSVSSMSSYEQSVSMGGIWFFFLMLMMPLLLESKTPELSSNLLFLFNWLALQSVLMWLLILLLLISLVCMTMFLQVFKGLIRSM